MANLSPGQVQAMNDQTRALVLSQGIPRKQRILSGTIVPTANNNVITVLPRMVGLLRSFIIEITATITNADGTNALNLTDWGVANLLSNITFWDLNNQARINTNGAHLMALDSVKRRRGSGAANVTDSGMFTDRFNTGAGATAGGINYAPASIAHSTAATVRAFFRVPITYSATDLKGGIYLGIINANPQLQFTINPNPVLGNTADPYRAVYRNAASATPGGSITSLTYTVYQDYLDNILVDKNRNPILPQLDIGTMYELKQIPFSAGGMAVSNDFVMQFPNFRAFLSTFLNFDNGGTFYPGTDTNYISIRTANLTDTIIAAPEVWMLGARDIIGTDLPTGCYYLDSRDQPIQTTQSGNVEIVLNPSVVNTGAYSELWYEDLGNLSIAGVGASMGIGG